MVALLGWVLCLLPGAASVIDRGKGGFARLESSQQQEQQSSQLAAGMGNANLTAKVGNSSGSIKHIEPSIIGATGSKVIEEMQIWTINHAARDDRWEKFVEQFSKMKDVNPASVHRIEGVDGSNIDLKQLNLPPSSGEQQQSWQWSPIRIAPRGMFDMTANKHGRRETSDGLADAAAVGQYMSHVHVWEKIVAGKYPFSVVVNDDIELGSDFNQRLAKAWDRAQALPGPVDGILLDYPQDVDGFLPTALPDIMRVRGRFHGLDAYMLTDSGAKKLLDHAMPIETQVETFMGMLTKNRKVNMQFYVLKAPIVSRCADPVFQETNTNIWNLCIKCMLPANNEFYSTFSVIQIVLLVASFLFVMQNCIPWLINACRMFRYRVANPLS